MGHSMYIVIYGFNIELSSSLCIIGALLIWICLKLGISFMKITDVPRICHMYMSGVIWLI